VKEMKYKLKFKAQDSSFKDKVLKSVAEFLEKKTTGGMEQINGGYNIIHLNYYIDGVKFNFEINFDDMTVAKFEIFGNTGSFGAILFTNEELQLFDSFGFELHEYYSSDRAGKKKQQNISDWFHGSADRKVNKDEVLAAAKTLGLTFTAEALNSLQSNIVDYINDKDWTAEEWFEKVVKKPTGEDVSELFEKMGRYSWYFKN